MFVLHKKLCIVRRLLWDQECCPSPTGLVLYIQKGMQVISVKMFCEPRRRRSRIITSFPANLGLIRCLDCKASPVHD